MGTFRNNYEVFDKIIFGYNHERFDISIKIYRNTISFSIHALDVQWLTGLPYDVCEVISSK